MQKKLKDSETLGEKIADIITPLPNFSDPEDDINEETKAKVVDNLNDENESFELVSKLRKQNFEFLEDVGERYIGKRSSRKNLNEHGDIETTDVEDGRDDEDSYHSYLSDDDYLKDIKLKKGHEEEDEGFINEEVNEKEDVEDRFRHISETNLTKQVSKAICVRNQLNIWESLLELRIQMQKSLLTANKMPQKEHFQELKQADEEYTNKVKETRELVGKLMDKLLQLQNILLRKYPETKDLEKARGKSKTMDEHDEEILSDVESASVQDEEKNEDEEEEIVPRKKAKLGYEAEINKRHELYRDYRNSVIQKWNEKTRIAAAKNNTPSYSVVDQIQYILANREKLIKRTQLKRSNYEILGLKEDKKEEEQSTVVEEYNANIFDDDDFYHQLLREYIEFKSADVSDPIQLGRQWVQLQHLRSKMKRKIDTRATKGRKVKYVVHSKLVNFMAPIDEVHMTEEAKSELFSSLFAKSQTLIKNSS